MGYRFSEVFSAGQLMDRVSAVKEADVVVIGGGHAGTQCALAAAENGASVIVLEAQSEKDISWVGEQIGTYNSQYLIDKGFGPYDLNEIVEEYCRCGSYVVNRAVINQYVKNSGELLDYLVSIIPDDSHILDADQCNVHEAAGKPTYPVIVGGCKSWAGTLQLRGKMPQGRVVGPYKKPKTTNMIELEKICMRRSQRFGAQWEYETSGAALIRESSGRVSGVIGKNSDGKYIRYNARKGILDSTGSFNANGIALAQSVGAVIEPEYHYSPTPMNVGGCFGNPSFIHLNANGKRFCNESIPYEQPTAFSRQPAGILSIVTDSKYFEQLERGGIQHGMPDFGMPAYAQQLQEDMSHVLEMGAEGYGVRDMAFSARAAAFPVYGAKDLETLADYIGYKGEQKANFLASIERYNEMCYTGRDIDFQKDVNTLLPIDKPPYYATYIIKEHNKNTLSAPSQPPRALLTNEDLCVLDEYFDPIEGLYAAGNTLGGRYGMFYPTPCGGNWIGMAMTHGRLIGKQLAAK